MLKAVHFCSFYTTFTYYVWSALIKMRSDSFVCTVNVYSHICTIYTTFLLSYMYYLYNLSPTFTQYPTLMTSLSSTKFIYTVIQRYPLYLSLSLTQYPALRTDILLQHKFVYNKLVYMYFLYKLSLLFAQCP